MPPLSASLLLLVLAAAVIWWQVSFIRMRLSDSQFDHERVTLIGIAGFITAALAFNAVTLLKNVHTEWLMQSQWMPLTRGDLMLRQTGFLFGFYALAMVFWNAIRGRVLDLDREVWEPAVRFGLSENQRLVAGVAGGAVSLPAVIRHAFAPYGVEASGLVLLIMIPLSLFALELLAEALTTKFMRHRRTLRARPKPELER